MDRRKFLTYVGCGCCGFALNSCTTAPITERKQLKIVSEARLNAQAAAIYEKVKEKEKMSDDIKSLNEIKEIGKKMEKSVSSFFEKEGKEDASGLSAFERKLRTAQKEAEREEELLRQQAANQMSSLLSGFYFRASIMNPIVPYSLSKLYDYDFKVLTPTLGWSSYLLGITPLLLLLIILADFKRFLALL